MTTHSLHHSFDIDLATEYGMDCAILIHHFQHWINVNARLGKNFHKGKTWMYQSLEAVAANFPYLSLRQTRGIIDKLVAKGILEKDNFNATKYDRTVWYSFKCEEKFSICRNRQMDEPTLANQNDGMGTPIPDTKTDAKKNKGEASASAPPPPLIRFGEFVEMTADQHNKLLEKFGEEETKAKIAKLDTYMGSTGKKYKSHYHTILNWHEKDQKDRETMAPGISPGGHETNRQYAETVERAYAAHPARKPTIQVMACGSCLEIYSTVGHVTPTQIKYSEHGFKEQVQNALRKWGLK